MREPLSGQWIGGGGSRFGRLLLALASLLVLTACASLANRPPPVTVSDRSASRQLKTHAYGRARKMEVA